MNNYKLKKEFQKSHPFKVVRFIDGAQVIFDSRKPFTESLYKMFPEYLELKVPVEQPQAVTDDIITEYTGIVDIYVEESKKIAKKQRVTKKK